MGAQEEIIDLCREGHLQARAAIRQLSCDIEVRIPAGQMINPYSGKMENRPAEVQHFSWWEDQDVVRCIGSYGGMTEDYLWKEGTLKTLRSYAAKGKEKTQSSDGQLDGPDSINRALSAWGWALFHRPEQIRELMSPPNVVSGTEESVGGQRLFKVTLNHDNAYIQDLFFDPRRNYVVSQSVIHNDLQDLASQHVLSVTRFTEPKPGIYFPAGVKHTTIYKGKSETKETFAFLNVRVNEPIDPAKLQLRFPAGIYVGDTRRGVGYTVDENEQPIGPEELLPTALQSASPWRSIALWSTAGVVLLGVVFLVIRWRRAIRA
jgi:hypothetical protein